MIESSEVSMESSEVSMESNNQTCASSLIDYLYPTGDVRIWLLCDLDQDHEGCHRWGTTHWEDAS